MPIDWTDKLDAPLWERLDGGHLPIGRPLPSREDASRRAAEAVATGALEEDAEHYHADILPVIVRCYPGLVEALAEVMDGTGRVVHRLEFINAVSGWVVPEAIWHIAQLPYVVAIESMQRFRIMTLVREDREIGTTGALQRAG